METIQKTNSEPMFIPAGITIEGFYNSCYFEYLEETSFLYEHRLSLIDDSEISWLELSDFDKRFEAYIDALVVGGEPALNVCMKQAIEGDYGELHASIIVFCRQKRIDNIKEIIDSFDFEDEERVKAITDALCKELPEDLQDDFLNYLFEKNSDDNAVLAVEIIAFRSLNYSSKLYELLSPENQSKRLIIAIFKTLGCIKNDYRKAFFHQYLSSNDSEIVNEVINAIIKSGDQKHLDELIGMINPDDWPALSLGLCGDNQTLNSILTKISGLLDAKEPVDKDYILSVGLIGNIAAVPMLITFLLTEDTAENASIALNLITGANLFEELFIPDEIDEEMLYENELEKYRNGELYAPGEEPGETITRLSQNPGFWEQWWEENKDFFSSEINYRNGKPCSPNCLLENLISENSINAVRKLAYQELTVRYGVDVNFDVEMTVEQQLNIISIIKDQIEKSGTIETGTLYYNRQKLQCKIELS